MPGAPLEPGKPLKAGGGPYGFPGAGNGQHAQSVLVAGLSVSMPFTSVWVVRHVCALSFAMRTLLKPSATCHNWRVIDLCRASRTRCSDGWCSSPSEVCRGRGTRGVAGEEGGRVLVVALRQAMKNQPRRHNLKAVAAQEEPTPAHARASSPQPQDPKRKGRHPPGADKLARDSAFEQLALVAKKKVASLLTIQANELLGPFRVLVHIISTLTTSPHTALHRPTKSQRVGDI